MPTSFVAVLTVSAVLCSTAFHNLQPNDMVKRSSLNHRHHDTLRMAQTEQRLETASAASTNSPITGRSKRKTPEGSKAKAKTNPTNTAQSKSICDQIKALGDAREWSTAKELFLSRKSPSKAEFSAAIFAARGCKEHKDGMKLYEMMVKDLGQQSVNLYTYDNIISLNLDYGDDKRALEVFKSLQNAEKMKKDKHASSGTVQPKLTAASEINLQKCIFNALRASLNIQFQSSKLAEGSADSKSIASTGAVKGIVKSEDVAFFHSSSPTKNAMEETIQSILDQDWVFLPKDKSLIVRAYASWNMTVQLAEMTDFIFQDPLPDMWTLQTYMNSMLENHPELALLSLQWYLPVRATEGSSEGSLEGSGTDTILSSIISSTSMAEKRKGRDTLSNLNTETISARCLGLAVKALARLDYFVGHAAKIDAILQMLRYAEDNDDLTAGLVVAAIGACRDLNDWQGAYQIYSTVKVAVAEGRFYDSTVGSSGNGDAKNGKGSHGSAAVTSVKTDYLKSVNTKTVNGGKNQNQDPVATENGLRVLRTIPSIVYGQAVVTMAKGGAESQSYQVFCEMLEAGVVPSTMTTNNVIMELSKKGSYKVAIAILDQLVRYQVSVSTAALNSLFNACDKVGAHEKVLEIFATKKVAASQMDEVGLSVLIKSCDRLGDAEWAVTILKEAIKAGLRVDFSIYQRVFAILVKSPNAAQAAVDMLLNIERAAVITSRIAARASDAGVKDDFLYTPSASATSPIAAAAAVPTKQTAGDVSKSLEAIDEVESLIDSLPDSIDFYDSFSQDPLSDLMEDSDVLDDTFRDLIAFNTPPVADPCIYSATISSLSHNRLAKEATLLLKSYSQRGGYETEEMYTSAIYAYRYQRSPDSAKSIFDALKKRSTRYPELFPGKMPLSISMASYNALLAVYAVSKVLDDRADEILKEMEEKNLTWDSYTYTALMMGRGDRQEVIRLWGRMVEDRVLPTQAAAAELFKACEMEGCGMVSLQALKWLWALNPSFPSADVPQGVPPIPYIGSASPSGPLDSDTKGARINEPLVPITYAMGVNALPHSPVVIAVPDLVFCSRTLTALSNEGLSGECLLLLEEMRERGLTPTPACYAVALNALEKEAEWQKAVNLILQMQTRGVLVDYRAVNTAMSACAKAQQWSMVLKLYDQMPTVTGHAFVPNQFSYFQALQAACKTKNAAKAKEILSTKSAAGILPSTASIAQVMAALEVSEAQHETVKVFEDYVSCHLSAQEFDTKESLTPSPMVIDLHGYSMPIARAAVRSALYMLQKEAVSEGALLESSDRIEDIDSDVEDSSSSGSGSGSGSGSSRIVVNTPATSASASASASVIADSKVPSKGMGTLIFPDSPPKKDPAPVSSSNRLTPRGRRSLVIITGIGKNSREEEPVLKPALQLWLENGFKPSLTATEVQDNPGRIEISGDCLHAWIGNGGQESPTD